MCGITHTTATETIMRNLAEYFTGPLHDFDTLICTSSAVRDSVDTQLEGIGEHMAAEYGPRRRHTLPQRVTIPLGINVDDFNTSGEQRRAWRERLGIPADALVALYVGRFNVRAKMNPALMALALEGAAKRIGRKIWWVNSGWAGGDAKNETAFHEPVRALCPSVEYRHLDGRPADVRFSIWSVADLFISFSDNIQETFGLTPVEAMAAGLPCVVSDWDGYRDTVRDGEDGIRVPTYMPAPGDGRDLAYSFQTHVLSYDNYVGATGQLTAVDLRAATDAIVALAEDAALRGRLGASARRRAQETFDWSVIIPQYQALWAEQNARRLATRPTAPVLDNPLRPDPFLLFRGYPTKALRDDWRVELPEGASWAQAERVLSSPLAIYSSFNRPTPEEARAVFEQLAEKGPSTVAKLAELAAPGRWPFLRRGILWMARYGTVVIKPE
jgi:glycosyltransferase involved in cell wall biosynthesis